MGAVLQAYDGAVGGCRHPVPGYAVEIEPVVHGKGLAQRVAPHAVAAGDPGRSHRLDDRHFPDRLANLFECPDVAVDAEDLLLDRLVVRQDGADADERSADMLGGGVCDLFRREPRRATTR